MIKYKLICKDCETTFDSWFSSSKEYEKLKKKKFLNCHFCNSLNVGKGLMSPSVSTSKNNLRDTDSSSEKYREIKKTIYKYQEFIKKILNKLEKILHMRQDLCIIKIKKKPKVFMELQQKKILTS
jgi:hypothetical protein